MGHERSRPIGRGSVDVREEDAFDVAVLAAWLREHADGVPDGEPEVRQFPGGASNLTYLLRYPSRDLILRRPPAGVKAKSAHDMQREFTIQSRLGPVFDRVPEMVAFCDDQDVIGSDFYVMERLEGTILRRDLPEDLTLTPRGRPRPVPAASSTCWSSCTPSTRRRPGSRTWAGAAGYVARQVRGWSDRFRAARTDNVGDYERVMGWLDEHQPEDVATTVIHNDFRLDNVVLDRRPLRSSASSTGRWPRSATR